MSERSDLNPPDQPQPDGWHGQAKSARAEIPQIITDLQPQALEVNRDELFFQAGYAAGSNSGGMPKMWPVAAAALLLISVGLASALTYQTMALHSTQYALKWMDKSQATIAVNAANPPLGRELGTERQAAAEAVDNQSSFQSYRIGLDERSLRWQRLASPAPLPPGRLTAMGWEPRQVRNGEWGVGNERNERPPNSDEPPASSKPHRPSTYLDLLRLQQEG